MPQPTPLHPSAPLPERVLDADLFADRREDRRARAWLAIALTLAVATLCVMLWWFDRVAAPPSDRPRVSWVPAPRSTERALASREVGEVRP